MITIALALLVMLAYSLFTIIVIHGNDCEEVILPGFKWYTVYQQARRQAINDSTPNGRHRTPFRNMPTDTMKPRHVALATRTYERTLKRRTTMKVRDRTTTAHLTQVREKHLKALKAHEDAMREITSTEKDEGREQVDGQLRMITRMRMEHFLQDPDETDTSRFAIRENSDMYSYPKHCARHRFSNWSSICRHCREELNIR